MNNEKHIKEKELLAKQDNILAKEEIFWKQNSHETWLEEGDIKTKKIHNSTLNNRNVNKIMKIRDNEGNISESSSQTTQIFTKYFSNILNNLEHSNLITQKKMLSSIPKILTGEDNKYLNKKFTIDETKEALFHMNPNKSLGPNGFKAFFFKKWWNILGQDPWEAIGATENLGSILS